MIKFNGQDLADIKFNGQSIKRVMKDGVQIWPSASEVPNIPTGIQLSEYDIEPADTYLLDDYPGAAAAYSLRKLRTGVIQGIMVRRDSDDQLVDVRLYDDPSKSIDLDSITESGGQTLGEWVGSASAYVQTWYDQSGSGVNVTQTASASQPILIVSGVLNVDNGTTYMQNTGSTAPNLEYNGVTGLNNTSATVFMTNGAGGGLGILINGDSNIDYISAMSDSTGLVDNNAGTPSYYKNGSITELGRTRSILYENYAKYGVEVLATITNINFSSLHFDNRLSPYSYTGAVTMNLRAKEVIIYNSDQTANRTAIETNINEFYNIWVVTAEVDAQLIQADNDNVSDTVIEINGVRSSASDTAVANLITRNNTIITN